MLRYRGRVRMQDASIVAQKDHTGGVVAHDDRTHGVIANENVRSASEVTVLQ